MKLFRNGRNQAVRIPREFELPGNDAIMLLAVLDKLSPIQEKVPIIAELATEPVDL